MSSGASSSTTSSSERSPPSSSRLLLQCVAWGGFAAILALAAFVRFDALAEPSLWLDEILHLEKARAAAAAMGEGAWTRWVTGLLVDRENGPLYYAGQLVALWAVGEPLEAAVRLVPALAGLLTVAVVFFVGRRVFDDGWSAATVGLAAAALLALSPLHVVYSREGRPYAAVMLAAALLLWCALAGRVRENRRWSRVVVYPLCLATACLGAIAAPVLLATGMLAALSWLGTWWAKWRRDGSSWWRAGLASFAPGRGHLAVAAALGLALLPLLFPDVQGIRQVRGEEARAVDHGGDLTITTPWSPQARDRLLASLTVSGLDAGSATTRSWIFVVLAGWGALTLLWRRPRAGLWVVGLCVLPIGGWLVLLRLYDHWYNVRYTSAGLPAFLVLVAVGAVDPIRRVVRWRGLGRSPGGRGQPVRADDAESAWTSALLPILAALAVLPLAASGWQAVRTEPWQKPDWRGSAALVESLALPGEPLIARDPWAAVCLGHYLRQLDPSFEVHSADYELARVEELTARFPRAWVAAAGYRRASWLEDWLRGLDFVLARPGADFRLYFHPDFAALASAPGRGATGSDDTASLADRLEALGLEPGVDELAESELLLGPGWSSSERQSDGLTFRWAAAERAELALAAADGASDAADPEARRLRVRLRPFPSPDSPPQTVIVTVNGEAIDELVLAPGWQEVTTATYRSRRALDHVIFTFAWQQAPRDVDPASGDRRRLAAAFDRVAMEPAVASASFGASSAK